MTSVILDDSLGVSRDGVMAALKQRHIDSRPFFPPMSSFPMFQSREEANPVAYRIAGRGLNLPSGHNLTEADVERVCRCLLDAISMRHKLAA
jgi:perosamine synthetase